MAKTASPKTDSPNWEFKPRFRRHAFGWRSQPAVQRVKEAVAEIKRVVRKDPALAAEGAVMFLERVSPALEQVDGSSGSIGNAVNNAIAELVPVIAGAPIDTAARLKLLDRLFEAHAADKVPYIEVLADYWGELCASKEVASEWADRLLDMTHMALTSDKGQRVFFHGTSAFLSALYAAERYAELLELMPNDALWHYKRWAVKALIAQDKRSEALRYAEASRNPWANDQEIDRFCEEILLSSGMVDEAYRRYGLTANRGGTYLATFRAVAKKYPHKAASEILADLVQTTPGAEGKWFAAAKDAGLFAEALALAQRTPCDPRTLTRSARDHLDDAPDFATSAGLLALHWLSQGYGYEITGADVLDAYKNAMRAAERSGRVAEVKEKLEKMLAADRNSFVARVLGAVDDGV